MRSLGWLFLLSGAAALVVETTWLRWFRQLLGATAPAASVTLTAFFAGQALGAAVGARWAGRTERPLRLYARLEAGAAAGALALPLLLVAADAALTPHYDALRSQPGLLTTARFAVALLASLPAAACFGASWPAMATAAIRGRQEMGSRGGALYALNVTGAAIGVVLASFWLPPSLGVNGTYAVGIALSLAAAGGAGWLARSAPPLAPTASPEKPTRTRTLSPEAIALAALSGFGHFAAQVLLVQSFAMVLNQSVAAFGAVLFTVLATMALGAAGVAWTQSRGAVPPRTLVGLTAALASLGLAAFPAALTATTNGLEYVGATTAWPGYVFAAIGVAVACAGPALLAMGALFPLTFALVAGEDGGRGRPGSALGWLAAANTAGALAGAVAGPYAILPIAGLWGGFLLLAGLYALPAIFFRDATASSRLLRDLAFAGGWVAVLSVANPLGLPAARVEPGDRVIEQRRTPAGLVSVVERGGERFIRTDNHYVLGGTAETVHEERQGHLPLLLHPNPKHVAFVGTATGATAGAALAHEVETIHLVEIVPAVADAARRHFGEGNRGVYTDPRASVVLDDARNFLARTALRFDVVVADLFVPWRAGTGALYTSEHFQNVRDRLTERGVFCQWLPLYQLSRAEFDSVAASFADVFPRASVWRGDFYGGYPIAALVGWAGAPPTAAEISRAAAALGGRGEVDRWVTDPVGVWALYATDLAPAGAEVPRNTDTWPRIEFAAARAHRGGALGKPERLTGTDWVQRVEWARERAAKRGEAQFANLGGPALAATRGGAALQLAGALYAEGALDPASRALAAAADMLPVELLAEGDPDPTAAELWHDRSK